MSLIQFSIVFVMIVILGAVLDAIIKISIWHQHEKARREMFIRSFKADGETGI